MELQIDIPVEQIVSFCHQYHIRRMMVFGSALSANFNLESDVDILVEFEDGMTPGLEFFTLHEKLRDILGREVDLGTPASLSKYIRDDVLEHAQVIYEG